MKPFQPNHHPTSSLLEASTGSAGLEIAKAVEGNDIVARQHVDKNL